MRSTTDFFSYAFTVQDDFNFQWSHAKNPYRAKLENDRLKLEDLHEYKCWWMTLDEYAVVNITEDFRISDERFSFRCIAFLGNNAIIDHLYPNEMAAEAIFIYLENNRESYIIGEKTSAIIVKGFDDIKPLPPEAILCTGLPFMSPFLYVDNVRTEGVIKVNCSAQSYGIQGVHHIFFIRFYSSSKFSLKTLRMSSQLFVIPTYEKSDKWENFEPSREAPNLCDVRCIDDSGENQFTNSLELAKMKSEYEAYDCYCVHKFKGDLDLGTNEQIYEFLIQERLIINRDSTKKCTLDVPKEIVLGLGNLEEKKRMAGYTEDSDKDCQPVSCQPTFTDANLIIAYNWSKKDATGYLNGSYRMPDHINVFKCLGIPIQEVDFKELGFLTFEQRDSQNFAIHRSDDEVRRPVFQLFSRAEGSGNFLWPSDIEA
ncbi:unnamed protein product [Schistocephalus solidus]|uniref:DUF3506 domain-containing protein n=1 Tax=Schistocephalus solidus TaxID=70667 RepID=A0A183T8G5_SCHSO|nr:unnamed protein product [Schistocephalus solidus]